MISNIEKIKTLNRKLLKEKLNATGNEQKQLFDLACFVRDNGRHGKNVEVRSVIEISNICRQKCKYCSIGRDTSTLYKLSGKEIEERLDLLIKKGRRTFLIQSGEYIDQNFIDDICNASENILKKESDTKLIVNLGNLKDNQYKQLKNAGIQRYLIKFETSNPQLHKFCRPSDTFENRLEHIKKVIDLGFEVGSGNIIGLPQQTDEDLIDDLILTTQLNLSMVSASKFISNPQTEFKNEKSGDINKTLNFIALLRILNPDCLIPSTTSLQTEDKNGQLMGLLVGCNTITVHDGTPNKKEKDFNIYTKKRFIPDEEFCLNVIKEANLKPAKFLI